MDNNNSNEDNSNMDMEMDSMSNYIGDWLGQKEHALRSWKRILQRSNFQTSVENLPNLLHAGKQPSSTSSSLNSSIHKKKKRKKRKAICLDSLNVS